MPIIEQEDSFQVGPGLDCELESASVSNCSWGAWCDPALQKVTKGPNVEGMMGKVGRLVLFLKEFMFQTLF